MPKVTMTTTAHGSDELPNGVNLGPSKYVAGKTYDVSHSLAKNLIAAELAKHADAEVDHSTHVEKPEPKHPKGKKHKNLGAAPENK